MPNVPGRQNIGRVRAAVEGTFGADLSGSLGSFGDLRVIEGLPLPSINPEMLKDGRNIQYALERPLDVKGFRKSNGLALKGNLFSTGQSLVAAASVTKTTQSKVLEVIAGVLMIVLAILLPLAAIGVLAAIAARILTRRRRERTLEVA
jgi:hypothetical protein